MIKALLFGLSVVGLAVSADAATPGHTTSQSAQSPHPGSDDSSSGKSGASLGGEPIPGLCMLSQLDVLSKAKVALAADVRLKQLQQQVQIELKTEQTAIESDAQALQAESNSLSPADFQKRQAPLQARVQA